MVDDNKSRSGFVKETDEHGISRLTPSGKDRGKPITRPRVFEEMPTSQQLDEMPLGEFFGVETEGGILPEIPVTPISGTRTYTVRDNGLDQYTLWDILNEIDDNRNRYRNARIVINSNGIRTAFGGTRTFQVPEGVRELSFIDDTSKGFLTQSGSSDRLDIIGHSSCQLSLQAWHMGTSEITGFYRIVFTGQVGVGDDRNEIPSSVRYTIRGVPDVTFDNQIEQHANAQINMIACGIRVVAVGTNIRQRLRGSHNSIISTLNQISADNVRTMTPNMLFSTLITGTNSGQMPSGFFGNNNFQSLIAANPHTLTVGIEHDLCDGTFIRRFSGQITAAANFEHSLNLGVLSATGVGRVIEYGGFWCDGNASTGMHVIGGCQMLATTAAAANPTAIAAGTWSNLVVGGVALYLKTRSTVARSSRLAQDRYEVWIRYTKA